MSTYVNQKKMGAVGSNARVVSLNEFFLFYNCRNSCFSRNRRLLVRGSRYTILQRIDVAAVEIFYLVYIDEKCSLCFQNRYLVIPSFKMCDGIVDCPGLSDECLCPNKPDVCHKITWSMLHEQGFVILC